MFRVRGTIAAGDDPNEILRETVADAQPGSYVVDHCVEIMTGAIFPDGYDACVKVEDTIFVESRECRYVQIMQLVPGNANRRIAGNDI